MARWLGGSILLILLLAGCTQRSDQLTPLIHVEQPLLDVGVGDPGSSATSFFTLGNSGKAVLKYGVQETCACIVATPRQGEIPPGGTTQVKITFGLPEVAGQSKSVPVVFADREHPESLVECLVIGRSRALAQVSPAHVEFGTLLLQEASSKELSITVSPDIGDLSLLTVDSDTDESFYDLDRTDFASQGRLTFRLKSGLPPGHYRNTVRIRDRSSRGFVPIPVSCSIVEAMDVVPRRVVIQRDPANGGPRPVNVFLVVHQQSLHNQKIALSSSTPGVRIQSMAQSGKLRPVMITFSDEACTHDLKEIAITSTDGIGAPLTLRIEVLL